MADNVGVPSTTVPGLALVAMPDLAVLSTFTQAMKEKVAESRDVAGETEYKEHKQMKAAKRKAPDACDHNVKPAALVLDAISAVSTTTPSAESAAAYPWLSSELSLKVRTRINAGTERRQRIDAAKKKKRKAQKRAERVKAEAASSDSPPGKVDAPAAESDASDEDDHEDDHESVEQPARVAGAQKNKRRKTSKPFPDDFQQKLKMRPTSEKEQKPFDARIKPERKVARENVSLTSIEDSPIKLARSFSLEGIYRSAGFNSPTFLMPNAEWNRHSLHASMYDMPLDEALLMIGVHLLWRPTGFSELISFTNSPIFVIFHGWRRRELGQGKIYICIMDQRKMTTPSGRQVKVYAAPDMMATFEVMGYPDWHQTYEANNLQVKYFNHESLVHGNIEYPKKATRFAPLDELEAKGLFFLFDDLLKLGNWQEPEQLYRGCHYLRSRLHKTYRAVEKWELDIAKNCARSHLYSPDRDTARADLWDVIFYLSIRGRPRNNELFIKWIREQRYQLSDITDYLYPNYHKIPDNLPERIAHYNLVSDALTVLRGAPLPPIELVAKDKHTGGEFAADDRKKLKFANIAKDVDPASNKGKIRELAFGKKYKALPPTEPEMSEDERVVEKDVEHGMIEASKTEEHNDKRDVEGSQKSQETAGR